MSNARELSELAGSYGTGGFVGMKNRIINGGMVIDQRNAGASVTPATTGGNYLVDRWLAGLGVASKLTLGQNLDSVTPPSGFVNYLGAKTASAYSVTAGDVFNFQHRIEGFNGADLAWGTASAASVTLSFWVQSSLTGTFGGSVRNGAQNRAYPFAFTINSANTWEQKTITVAGDTSGTWATGNTAGIMLAFSLGTGSTYNGTAGSWVAGDIRSVTGAVSVVGTLNATFYITGVQLEKGSTATSFDYRPYGTELALCQRYCYVQQATGATYAFGVSSANSIYPLGIVTFPVQLRAGPSSVTLSAASTFTFGSGAPTSVALDSTGLGVGIIYGSGGTAATGGVSGMFRAANSSAKIIWDAEL